MDGADTPEIDDFCFDTFFSQVFSGLQCDMQHAREGDNRHMLALAFDLSSIERYCILNAFVGDFAFHVVEQLMLDEQHGIRVVHCRLQHTLSVVRGGSHDYFEAGDMRIPGLQRLRVLRASLCSTPARHTYNEGYFWLSTEHVTKLGGLINDLITGKQAELDGHPLGYGT